MEGMIPRYPYLCLSFACDPFSWRYYRLFYLYFLFLFFYFWFRLPKNPQPFKNIFINFTPEHPFWTLFYYHFVHDSLQLHNLHDNLQNSHEAWFLPLFLFEKKVHSSSAIIVKLNMKWFIRKHCFDNNTNLHLIDFLLSISVEIVGNEKIPFLIDPSYN